MGVTNKLTINQSAKQRTTVAISYDFEPEGGTNQYNVAAKTAEDRLKKMPLQAIVKSNTIIYVDDAEERAVKLIDAVKKNISDVNFGIGFAYAGAMEIAAKDNPDKTFVIIDSPTSGEFSNFYGTYFRMREATYSGAFVCNKLFPGAKIGALLPYKDLRPTDEFYYGLVQASKDFDFELDVKYMSEEPNNDVFIDPNTASDIATDMYNDGCKVIFSMVGNATQGALMSAKDYSENTGTQYYIVFPDVEGQYALPEYNKEIIGSSVKNTGETIVSLTKKYETFSLVEGGSTISTGLKEKGVNFILNNDNPTLNSTDDILLELEGIIGTILNGDKIIPDNTEHP